MISWRKALVWLGSSLFTLCILAAVLVVVGLYTPIGQRAVERLVKPLTGGTVAVYGLSGNLPDHLRVARLELRDARGSWLRLDDLTLDWNAFAILRNHLEAARLQAAHGTLLRLPLSSGKSTTTPTLDIGDLSVHRIDLTRAVLGYRAALAFSGALHFRSMHDLRAKITATRLDDLGRYRIDGGIANGMVAGVISISEGNRGLIGGLAGLPDLGAVDLEARATVAGSRNALMLRAMAGPLRADAAGAFDLTARTGKLEFAMDAPAMRPRREIGWQSLSVKGLMQGSLEKPDVHATLDIQKASAFGFAAEDLHLEVNGTGGTAGLVGTAEHLTIPGSRPDLLAADPVRLSANVDLLAKSRPVQFALEQAIVEVHGNATMAGARQGHLRVRLPSLAPVGAALGIKIEGSASFDAQINEPQPDHFLARLRGDIAPSGRAILAQTLGTNAVLNLSASMAGSELQSARGDFTGRNLSARFQGSGSSRLNYTWGVAVPNLSLAAPVTGSLELDGRLTGSPQDMRMTAKGNAEIGTKTIPKQRIAIEADATGLPNARSGNIRVSGQFAGGGLTLAATLSGMRNGMQIAIQRAAWKSAQLSGSVVVSNSTSAKGAIAMRMARLEDLTPLVGPVSGAAQAQLTIAPVNGAIAITPDMTLSHIRYGNIAANDVTISGNVRGLSAPVSTLKAKVRGFSSGGVGGDAELAVNGPVNDLALQLSSKLSANGQPIALAASASADSATRQVRLQTLHASWQKYALVLMAPARVDLTNGVAITDLRVKVGAGGVLTLAGSLSPKLSLVASVTGMTPEMAQSLLPSALDGVFSANATLAGTLAAPTGDVRVHGRSIRMRGAPSTVPVSSLEAHGVLQGDLVAFDATLSGGKAVQLAANGRVPFTATGPMTIAAKGTADLAVLGASLAATGQSMRGTADIDVRLAGTWTSPRASGSVQIANGEFRDFVRGLRLMNIHARLEGQGTSIQLANFSAAAGTGTMTASGTIDLAAPGIPVNIGIRMNNARPISSDLLDATLESQLRLTGTLKERLALDGEIKVLKANINVPNKFPPNVAQIDIRRGQQGSQAPAPPSRVIALDLTVSSPGQTFVRGRGLDAEFSGSLAVKGTSAAPQVLGALEMRRGTFSLAGTTLDFQSGKISFEGTSLRNRLDPTLDFVAETTSGGVTATLNLSGFASAPKIQLTSTPSLPEDEIMARLLFQQSASQLSALQVAEMADAIASLSGAGSGLNPVASLRKSLGLDRLAVGSTSSASGGTEATVEAGKYISRNVYVGTTQNVAGGTRAVVQVDITKHLKAQAAVGTGIRETNTTPLTPAQDTGDTVGLTYQLEY